MESKQKLKKATKKKMVGTDLKKATKVSDEFNKARKRLREFMADNEEFFDEYSRLVSDYNTARSTAKKVITASGEDKFRVGDFSKSSSRKATYAYATLPVKLLQTPGLVTKIDADIKEALVMKDPSLATVFDKVKVTYEKTTSVRSPAELVHVPKS